MARRASGSEPVAGGIEPRPGAFEAAQALGLRPNRTTIRLLKKEWMLTSDESSTDPSGLAVAFALEFFVQFGWSTAPEQLVKMRREFQSYP